MINMEIAKFMFKFYNKMLPNSFDSYFTKLYNLTFTVIILDKKVQMNFFHYRARTEKEKRNFIISA